MINNQKFLENFKVPEVVWPYIDFFFTEEEIKFLEKYGHQIFKAEDIEELSKEKAENLLQDYYSRSLISYENFEKEEYHSSEFYSFLDTFVVTKVDKYRTIPEKDRKAIDDWYFKAYYDGLNKSSDKAPTDDCILPLDETLQYIENQKGQFYLALCDCRALSGDCGMPLKTCLNWNDSINSRAHRGISKKITKEEAKQVVRNADNEGLMHTVNKNGICNCCGDCCYLFRSQRKIKSTRFWPKSYYKVELDPANCIGCGKCVRRCHLNVFSFGKPVQADTSKCVGCGICVTGCPKDALKLIKLSEL